MGRQPDPRPLDGPSGDHFQSAVVLADGVRATYLLEAGGEGRTEVLLLGLDLGAVADGEVEATVTPAEVDAASGWAQSVNRMASRALSRSDTPVDVALA